MLVQITIISTDTPKPHPQWLLHVLVHCMFLGQWMDMSVLRSLCLIALCPGHKHSSLICCSKHLNSMQEWGYSRKHMTISIITVGWCFLFISCCFALLMLQLSLGVPTSQCRFLTDFQSQIAAAFYCLLCWSDCCHWPMRSHAIDPCVLMPYFYFTDSCILTTIRPYLVVVSSQLVTCWCCNTNVILCKSVLKNPGMSIIVYSVFQWQQY